MKISWNWLRELVDLPAELGPKEVAARLGLCGVAVDGIHPVGVGLSGAIVAEVVAKRPHPKADKLTIVTVFDGQSETEVVCGAPNVPSPGEGGREKRPRVVWARPGATLPSGMTLSVREVRGIPSPGMLCAEDELGLSEDHGGILVLTPEDGLAIGSDFAQGADLPDYVFELDITANRPDLLGHVGVARELAAILADSGARLRPQPAGLLADVNSGSTPAAELAQVEIADPQGCPRYLAHVLTGVKVGPSPLRLRLRLQRLGVRPRSNVVDATNLALLGYGHPLHAFDLAALRGKRVVIRRAQAGEKLQTLDDVERLLTPQDLVIADAERPTALAGVMGGLESEVRPTTTEILLESAYFDPQTVRRTARRLRLHTEASHRFERGADPNDGVRQAAEACAAQIVSLAGGCLAPGCLDVYPEPRRPVALELRPARTSAIWGMEIPVAQQIDALQRLGLQVQIDAAQAGAALRVHAPTFRPDLTREIDLIEEVGRVYGLEKLAPTLPKLQMAPPPESTPAQRLRRNAETARDICTALGLDEVILFSMIGPERLRLVGGSAAVAPLRLDNPLREELSVLRTQLLPGLLDALHHNLSHGLTEVRLFEVGEVFLPRAGQTLPDEPTRAAAVLCGHREHALKPGPADRLDVHDVRGMVEQLLAGLGYELLWAAPGGEAQGKSSAPLPHQVFIRAASAAEAPWLHPGVAAVIVKAATGEPIGSYGEVHPDLRHKLAIELPIFAFELAVPDFARPAQLYSAPSRFPAVTRDLSFFVATGAAAGDVIAALHGAGEPLLSGVHILEDYREAGHVPAGQKGLLFNLTYRHAERTLVDEEVHKAHERVVAHLQSRFTIALR